MNEANALTVEADNRGPSVREALLADASQIASIYNYYVENTVITFEESAVSAQEMSGRISDVQAKGLPWFVAE
jgi:phosphinothricin acetyltransferase